MDHHAFRHLLKRYLEGSCTEEEKRLVEQWYELVDNEPENVTATLTGELETRLWNKIQPVTVATSVPVTKKNSWRTYAAAALVIGMVGAGIFLWGLHRGRRPTAAALLAAKVEEGFLKVINRSDTVETIILEDKSQVAVYPGATLAYPSTFAPGKREVYLNGEAFFTISRQANRPFFVYNNAIVTQVLGTSFGIQIKNGEIEVAVKSGKVAVYENKEQLPLSAAIQKSNGVILTPNQQVTYYEEARHFVTSLVAQPVPVADTANHITPTPHFNYNETALAIILSDLEKAYELEIELENVSLANCPFTGDLSGQHLFRQLEGICLVFNATYEIKGTTIFLKGGKQCD